MTPRPACLGQSEPYDLLLDHNGGPIYRMALKAARDLCGGCALRDACLTANRDEPWARAVLGIKWAPTTDKTVDRFTELTALADDGATLDQAAAHLGIGRTSLTAWCRKHNHMDLWRRLGGRPKPKRHLEAPCGTESGYYRHKRQRQRPCEECREAKNALERKRYHERRHGAVA